MFYHGSADSPESIAKHEFCYRDQFVPKPTAATMQATEFHILITTYVVGLKDVDVVFLKKIRWNALIANETHRHRRKHPKARLSEELASVSREFCILLTGTPLQNSAGEL